MAACRVCRRKDAAQTIDVDSVSEENQLPVSVMLMYCAQVEVFPGEQICSECLINLETAFNFRKQCRQPSATPTAKPTYQKPFQCCLPDCTLTATSLRELVVHSKTVHANERAANSALQKADLVNATCPICCAGFISLNGMKTHSDTENINWTKYKCEKCELILKNASKYADHRVERCTGVPNGKAEPEAEAKFDDEANTRNLEVKVNRAMEVIKTGKQFRIKLTELEFFAMTERNYELMGKLVELVGTYNMRSSIFYVCETCGFQHHQKSLIVQHISTSQDCRSFYNTLGSYDPKQHEPWLRCLSCLFLATNPTTLMKHQRKFKHSGIRTELPQSSKAETVPDTEQCIEIDEPNPVESSVKVKVEADEPSSFPPPPKRAKQTPPVKRKAQANSLKCKCGQTFPQNLALRHHIQQSCPITVGALARQQTQNRAAPVRGVKNIRQCEACQLILGSPSDVVRHQQNHCQAYKQLARNGAGS